VNIVRVIAVLKIVGVLEAVRLVVGGSVQNFDVQGVGVVGNLQVVAALNVVEVVDIDGVFCVVKDTPVVILYFFCSC
jgi:hypothetical protein